MHGATKVLKEEKSNKTITYHELEQQLKDNIFDQDKAIEAVIKYMTIYFAKLNDPTKPVASLMFTGPTGTGKTELAKILAQVLGFEFKKIDMSEFAEEHTVHALIGAPPGYIGYNQPTIFEDISNKKTVLLLDEIEKAHPKVHRLFLQVMDNATITLSNNKKINLSNTILLMTANIGIVTSKTLGLTEGPALLSVNKEEVNKKFPPEFLGRLNGVIEFNKLSNKTITKIVNKFIKQFNQQLDSAYKASLDIKESAVQHLINIGYSEFLGARTIKNTLNSEVFLKVARIICDQKNIAKFNIDYTDKLDIVLEYHPEEVNLSKEESIAKDSHPEVDFDRSRNNLQEQQTNFETKKETVVLFTNEGMLYIKPMVSDPRTTQEIMDFIVDHRFTPMKPNRWFMKQENFTQSMFQELAFYCDRAGVKIKCDAVHMNKLNEGWDKSLKPKLYQPLIDFYYRNRANIELCLIMGVFGILMFSFIKAFKG